MYIKINKDGVVIESVMREAFTDAHAKTGEWKLVTKEEGQAAIDNNEAMLADAEKRKRQKRRIRQGKPIQK